MQAKIKEKREVAKGTLMVVFDLLGEEVDFRPGQYFWVTLLDPPYDDEKGPRRHISVVTSPNERGVLGLCTRLRDTAFKRSLAELPVGAEVDVEQPEGRLPAPGGHGARRTCSSRAESGSPSSVACSATSLRRNFLTASRSCTRIATASRRRFSTSLRELEQNNPNLRLVLTMTDDKGWQGEHRRIDAEFLRDRLGDDLGSFKYMLAGPPGMVEAMVETLQQVGVPDEQVKPGSFSGSEPAVFLAEAFERRADETGQRLEVVAALEHRGSPRRKRRAALRRARGSRPP